MNKKIIAITITCITIFIIVGITIAYCVTKPVNQNQPQESKSELAQKNEDNKDIIINNKKLTLDIKYPNLKGKLINVDADSTLNVRSKASLTSDILFKINREDDFTIKGKINDWYVIEYHNQLGFASEDYLTFQTETWFLTQDLTINNQTYQANTIINVASNNNEYYIIDNYISYPIDSNVLTNIDSVKETLQAKYQNGERTLLSNYTTKYSLSDTNRNHNMTLACQAISNVIVLPNEEFNWEQHIGPASQEQGYQEAGVIYDGEYTKGYGGGICQVSSTLYNACLNANLKITERHTHSKSVGYVPINMDATVSYQTSNYRFVNNTNLPIIINATIGNGLLTVELYQLSY